MTDVLDFINASARFMATDRPAVWSEEDARGTLLRWMEELRNLEEPFGSFASGDYMLTYSCDDDGEESWDLTRLLASATVYFDGSAPLIYSATKDSQVLTANVDLPSLSEIPEP